MTEDEKRQQKAMLLLDYHEAERNLSHLEAKAASASQRIMAVAEWLEHASKRNDPLHDTIYATKLRTEVNILRDPDIAPVMDFKAAVALMEEIRVCRSLVRELYERKQSLGLQ
jgi:hypothetical protein